MATRLLKFGTYTFPLGWKVTEDANTRVVPVAKLARQDGARVQRGYMAEKQITIEGGFYRGPLARNADIRSLIDGMRFALESGPANLYLYTDRYYRNVQAVEFPDTYEPTAFNRFANSRVRFIGPEPFSISTVNSIDTWSSPGGDQSHLITVDGTVPVPPIFTIVLAGSGAMDVNITITNTTTGETFTLITNGVTGQLHGGDIIVVDMEAKTVTVNGVLMMALFDGQWFTLAPGVVNQIDLTITGETTFGELLESNTASFTLNQANNWTANITMNDPTVTPVSGQWVVVASYNSIPVQLIVSTASGTHSVTLDTVQTYLSGQVVYGRVRNASAAQISDVAGTVGPFGVRVAASFQGTPSATDTIFIENSEVFLYLYQAGGGATIASITTTWNARYR